MIRTNVCLAAAGICSLLFGQAPAGDPLAVAAKMRETSATAKVQPGLVPLPPGAVTPRGWLRDWATEALNGITGHLDEYSATFGEAWKGHAFEARGANPDGTGWPLEQSSYWLDGAVRLAWIMQDRALMEKISQRLDPVVSGVLQNGESFIYWRPKAALGDGFNNWAHSHMGRALVAYYQATGDPRVLQALEKAYRDYPLPDLLDTFEQVSGATNLDAMLDTYLMTGDPALLNRALAYAERPAYRAVASQWESGRLQPGHNVIFYENIRVPALLYPWTGNQADLSATTGAIRWDDLHHLLPLGVGSGEEYHAGIGATRNVETCDVAASMWTYLGLLRVTGEGAYSDRIERIFFNAGPAPVARDFKTMCYYQSPNRYSAANPGEEPHDPYASGNYRFTNIGHEVLCCVGNLNRVIPSYAMHMWMATKDRGLAATLYGPSAVRAEVAGNVKVGVVSATEYPFQESITLTVTPEKEVTFPLYLRVPAWCRAPAIRVNGRSVPAAAAQDGFVKLERAWRPGDKVVLRFPMAVSIDTGHETPYPRIKYFEKNRAIAREAAISSPFASVSYGPLLFALPIRDENPNQEGPGARFQYALDLPANRGGAVKVVRSAMPAKWSWQLDAPLRLTVNAREFDWRPSEVEPLPKEPVKGGKAARISLIPYGCTKFRVSMFPIAETR